MKPYLILILITCTIAMASCSNSADRDVESGKEDTSERQDADVLQMPSVKQHFPGVDSLLMSEDSLYAPENFTGGPVEMNDTIPATPLIPGQLQPYLPYLVFNSTDSMAIDFVSYNYIFSRKQDEPRLQPGGPDTEVALVDFRNNRRKRILFLGSSGMVLDAKWEDEHTVLIFMAQEEGEDEVTPSILRFHTDTGQYEMYTYQGKIKADLRNYLEDKLNARVRTSRVS